METKQFVINSCLIHRYTLYENNICHKCDGICRFKHKELLNLCTICFNHVEHLCKNCLSCYLCGRFSRFPGYCAFCPIIFDKNTILLFLKKNPSFVLAYFLDSSFTFLSTKKNPVDKFIIRLVLEYL